MSEQDKSWLGRTLPALTFGLVAGLLLVTVRAPQGLDLIQTQATLPSAVYGWRAAALGAVAIGLWLARGPLPPGALSLGLALGFGVGGLLLDPWLEAQSTNALFLRLGAGFVGLLLVGRMGSSTAQNENGEDARPQLGELAGVALCGFGFALAADALGTWSSLWERGRPIDASYSATIFLALGWLGYASFRDLVKATGLSAPGGGRIALTGGLALAAASALGGIALLGDIASQEALESYLGTFRVRTTAFGRWDFAGLIAARGWALPGLIVGIALAGGRSARDFAALVVGAALAHAALPALGPLFFERGGDAGPAASASAATGTVIAILGLLVSLSGSAAGGRRVWAVVFGAVALAGVVFVPRPQFTPRSPWGLAIPDQELGLARPVGYLSVESARGFSEVLTVDRVRMSPIFEEEEADRVRMELSVALLASEVVDRGARVLFIGALTPSRLRALSSAGVTQIDRTAPWFDDLAAIENELFDGTPPAGTRVEPNSALDGIEKGAWDLVISPPSFGGRVVVPPMAPGDGTVVVCWYLAEHEASDLDWGERVLVATDGLLDLGIGVVAGDWSPGRAAPTTTAGAGDLFGARDAELALYPAGPLRRRAPGVVRLGQQAFPLAHDPVVATAVRLEAGAETERERQLTSGLVQHEAVQLPSPNWANRITGTETDFEALGKLRDAALGELPDATVAYLWEELAKMLVFQRDVQAVFDFVEPIAADRPFWPRLQEALGHADREFLEPEAAAARFERLAELSPFDIDLRLVLAETLEQAGRPADAVLQYEACIAIQPGRHEIERRLAMAMARAGDERARGLLDEILAEHPEDEDLQAFLGPGPFPPVEPSFKPGGHLHSFKIDEEGDEHEHGHGHEGHDH